VCGERGEGRSRVLNNNLGKRSSPTAIILAGEFQEAEIFALSSITHCCSMVKSHKKAKTHLVKVHIV
jgi:hypothetical protein